MENDQKKVCLIGNSELPVNSFKAEYETQDIKNNIKFQKWQKLMFSKYGEDAKLFKCRKNKIFFYASNEEYNTYPLFKSECPICKKNICFFCHRNGLDHYGNGTCCLSNKIYCFFIQDGFRFINPIGIDITRPPKYKKSLIIYFIPGINLLYFIATIHISFLYKLSLKDDMSGKDIMINYEKRFEDNYECLIFIILFDVISSIALSLAFIVLNTYFIVLLFLISIPFKLYPMKYYMGIAYGNNF